MFILTLYRNKFIRIMSYEEQLFCVLMSNVFDIPENQCGSVEDAIKRVRIRAKSFGLPFWVLKEKASAEVIGFSLTVVKMKPSSVFGVS